MIAALTLAFIAVPLVEIYLIVQVGQVLGALPTVALLLFEGLLGAWLVKREGRRAWAALRQGLRTGGMPDVQLADAALVLVGGTLLLTPGFLTDIAGFALVLPLTRPLGRRLLGWLVARQVRRSVERRLGFGATRVGDTSGAGQHAGAERTRVKRPSSGPGTVGGSVRGPGTAGGSGRDPGTAGGRVVRGEVLDNDA